MHLRLFTAWCARHHQALFEVEQADIESYARHLDTRGRARATVARQV